jgi:hypothetical protein
MQQRGQARFAAVGQHDQRQFRPRRLRIQVMEQLGHLRQLQRFLSDQQGARPFGQISAGIPSALTHCSGESMRAQQPRHRGRVLPDRREKKNAIFRITVSH